MNTNLFREILTILEMPINLEKTDEESVSIFHITDEIVAIHAKTPGTRIINLQKNYKLEDIIKTEIGWPARDKLKLPMAAGETRIFQIERD